MLCAFDLLEVNGEDIGPSRSRTEASARWAAAAPLAARVRSSTGTHARSAARASRASAQAVPMIGGMLSSTALTLIVIPAVYGLIKAWRLPNPHETAIVEPAG